MNKETLSLKLQANDNNTYSLSSFKGKNIVLYFYPKDNTPGCTIQSKKYSHLKPEFSKYDSVVIGVSGGNVKGKQKFVESCDLEHILLADENFELAKGFNNYHQKSMFGKKYMGVNRNTYIFDKNQNLVATWEEVNFLKDPENALEFVKNLK